MIDKIPPKLPASYLNDVIRPQGRTEAAPQGKARQAGEPSAEVSLSDDARALQRAMEVVKNTPDVRTDLVQEKRAQIEAGTYRIDFEALAGRLLSFLK